tara:strand:+ start:213 stop:464 length:252 start_codon:yes stop_codon:yes gene_type:complete
MEDYQKEDRLLITSIAGAVSKSILYIALCITASILFSKCTVDSETIAQCEDSCGSVGIREVTSWSCSCNDLKSSNDPIWVLPN